MAILKVARMGHPVLRAARPARSIPAQIRSPAIQQLIDDMFETMREYQGVGLAAPQVHESLRIFVAGFAPSPTTTRKTTKTSRARAADGADQPGDHCRSAPTSVEDWEGCLSIPDIRGRVPRARQITVRASIAAASASSCRRSGFTARVIQHETDHLDGVLFFDRMRSFETLTFLDEFGRYWSRPGSRRRNSPRFSSGLGRRYGRQSGVAWRFVPARARRRSRSSSTSE